MRYETESSRDDASPFDVCKENLIFLACHSVLWLLLLFLVDMWPELKGLLCGCWMRSTPDDNRTYMPINEDRADSQAVDRTFDDGDDADTCVVEEDVDVYNERMRVLSSHATEDSLQVINLRQVFKVGKSQLWQAPLLTTFPLLGFMGEGWSQGCCR